MKKQPVDECRVYLGTPYPDSQTPHITASISQIEKWKASGKVKTNGQGQNYTNIFDDAGE